VRCHLLSSDFPWHLRYTPFSKPDTKGRYFLSDQMTAIVSDLNKAYTSVVGSLEKNSTESKRMCPATGQRLSRVG